MRTKVEWAGVMALAATVLTALLSAQGSGAAASDLIPILTEQKPAVEFVSRPMVQALPAEDGVEETDGTEISPDADSLRELVSQQSMPDDMSNEMRCLAGAIYFEAKGEPLSGQLAVAEVILNRTKSGNFPKSVCSVVTQRGQFSFVRGGHVPSVPSNRQYRTAIAVARVALADSWDSPASNAMYFHARQVTPGWHRQQVASIGNHIFYR